MLTLSICIVLFFSYNVFQSNYLRILVSTKHTTTKHIIENVVISAAFNYPLISFVRFIGSLRNTGYRDDIVLFVNDDLPSYIIDYLQYHQVKFNNKFAQTKDSKWGYDFIRFKSYADICKQYRGFCISTDFRDSFFQVNPVFYLNSLRDVDLILSLEDPIFTLGSNSCNANWISHCFNSEVLRQLSSFRVICSGTVIANSKGMKAVWDIMHRELHKSNLSAECFDQGVLNGAVRLNSIRDISILLEERGFGIANTIGGADMATLPRDKEGYILNHDRNRSSIIHQYDRHTLLYEFVDKISSCSNVHCKI